METDDNKSSHGETDDNQIVNGETDYNQAGSPGGRDFWIQSFVVCRAACFPGFTNTTNMV